MDQQTEYLAAALADAGCKPGAIEKAESLFAAGRTEDLIRHLRLCRCDLMDELHESQKRVDCMDYVIRQAEKARKTRDTKGRQKP